MQVDIFSYITDEEIKFQTEEVEVFDNYSWSFKNHIQMSVSFLQGKFMTGVNDWTRPFKNIVKPLLNLRYRAEDIELKDVVLYVENEQGEHLSFLIKKYHDEVYIKENDLDSFFDEAKEQKIDFGGVLIQKTNSPRPEVLPLQSIVFCDQTDILGGPIGFKYNFSPAKLRTMSSLGWGDKANGATISLEELITLAEPFQNTYGIGKKKNQITGKKIEVYIVRGDLPSAYLNDDNNMEDSINQIQIVAFYQTKKERKGEILYRKKETESTLKFHTSKAIFGRALGEGGVEDLFEAQLWTNFLEIHKMQMLASGSKNVLYTDDQNYQNRNKISDMENNEITTISETSRYGIRQVPTIAPVNIQLFTQTINEWYQQAQSMASATDALLGENPASGTPFRLQQLLVNEGKSIHEYRKGKFAKFIEEIYREWIIPQIIKEILKGKEFLATLSSDEMQWVSERMAENYANRTRMDAVLDGKPPQDKEVLKQSFLKEFSKGGNKRWLEILKDEFRGAEIKIDINIAGKQKNLVELTDKLVNIVRQILATPQVLSDPLMRKLFDKILLSSGLDPAEFPLPTAHSLTPQIPPLQIPAISTETPLPA